MKNNSSETNYLRLGAFILIGLSLIIFALLVFSSGKLFQRIVYIETYFDESIQGISEGAPVKYRGLQIGYIDEIAFTNEKYGDHVRFGGGNHNRSLYVRMAITSKLFTGLPNAELNNFLTEEVKNGLRIKLVTQGLTGISYLEFNYVDPNINPLPIITWHPKDFYVPSTVSTLKLLSESAQYIVNELKDVNFKKIFEDVDQLSVTLSQLAIKTEVSLNQLNNPLTTVMQNFKTISENLRVISEQLKINPSSMVFGKPPPTLNPSKL